MKTWENATIEEVSFSATEHGGEPCMKFDYAWYDGKEIHTTFVS